VNSAIIRDHKTIFFRSELTDYGFFCENREPERLNYMHQNHLTSALSKMLLHRKLNTTEVKNSRTENWQQKYCNHFSRQWKWRSFINSKFVVKAQIATVPEGKAVDAN